MDKKRFMTESDVLGIENSVRDRSRFVIRNGIYVPSLRPILSLESFEDLLKRDKQREEDGFDRKIKIHRVLTGTGRVTMIPNIEEEKLIHGEFEPKKEEDPSEGQEITGQGQGEVGDVIREQTPESQQGGEGEDPQAGDEPGEHDIEGEAYRIGQTLSEKFQLPNLKDKGKKVPTDEYTYDLLDRHRGSGQVLDKDETLKSIVKTNISLGRLDKDNIDTTKFIVAPNDKVYRVLSREKVWKSQAMVFFLRDYSGSMSGEPTKVVVTQHLRIYAWLLVQYEKLVVPRFIVHDTEAKEVAAEKYYRVSVAGGTLISSAFKLVNEIVQNEGLDRDYNIYVFYGTDGDDFDDGRQTIPEIQKVLGYANRMGACVVQGPYWHWGSPLGAGGSDNEEGRKSRFEQYVGKSGLLERRDVFRMHVMPSKDVTEEKNIEAIKALIAQD